MITLRKANRIVRVSENELDKYTSIGYEVVNKQASVEVPREPAQPKKPIIEQEEVADDIAKSVVKESAKPTQVQSKRRNTKSKK